MNENDKVNKLEHAPRKYRAIPPGFTPRKFVQGIRNERDELKVQLAQARSERDKALIELKQADILVQFLLDRQRNVNLQRGQRFRSYSC